MEMTVTFTSLAEARDWAAEFLGYPLKNIEQTPTTRATPSNEELIEIANTPDESVGPVIVAEPDPAPKDVDPRAIHLGKNQRKVLAILMENNGSTVATGVVAAQIGVGSPVVSSIMSKLSKRGLCFSPKRGRWQYLTEEAMIAYNKAMETLDVANEEPVRKAEPVPEEPLPPEPEPTPPPKEESIDDLLSSLDL